MAEDKKISELIRVGNAGSPELSEVVKDSGNFKRQNNMTAESEPTTSADSDAGYSVGSFWYYSGVLWVCKDSSVGAAVWGKVTVAPRSTDGSIDIDLTDPSAPDLSVESGEWTPDITSITSGATVDSSSAFYSKGGTVVNFTIGLSVQLGGGSASTSFKLSLPIASDFANSRQVIFSTNLPSNLTYCVGSSNSTDNLIDVDVFGTANGDAIDGLQITGQYLIV